MSYEPAFNKAWEVLSQLILRRRLSSTLQGEDEGAAQNNNPEQAPPFMAGSVEGLTQNEKLIVDFLADKYEVNFKAKKVYSLSCNSIAPDHASILILHYLTRELHGLPKLSGEWITFVQLPGGLGYFDAFKKRAIDSIIRKYGKQPLDLLTHLDRFKAKKVQYGDCAIVIDVFPGVPVMVTVWAQDEEFGAEANILFDRSIQQVFPTEDIVVLAGFLAKQL